jgi:hypothetical protein
MIIIVIVIVKKYIIHLTKSENKFFG